ncbi:MAG: RNA methyltransferase [Gammaproteobacteria bacterium]|nr:RNA methyltransferase [Gammaproteobacteria bacterium]
MKQNLNNIRIILVGTTHPGNIGASARAMKCMGLTQLWLVNPPAGFPAADVSARAAGADDLLSGAVICDTLDAAIRDCTLVIGTTARDRSIPWPVLTPSQCAEQLLPAAASGPVAILFGRESSGLSNEEIDYCNAVVNIPTNPDFSSLNLAAAVQVIGYELYRLVCDDQPVVSGQPEIPLATHDDLELLYEHLERVMTAVGFYNPAKPRRVMRRLRRLFNRAQLDQNELNILRGFLAAIEETAPDEETRNSGE